MKIGVISDTHNYLDPKVAPLLAGVDHILHGGDIGMPRIILELEQIAPVTAVQGNTDDPGFGFRLTEHVELGGSCFLLHHIVNPHSLSEPLREKMARLKPRVVIFGHTHRPFCEMIDEVLFFNPGYAGKSRFGMERSVAVLHITDSKVRPEFARL